MLLLFLGWIILSVLLALLIGSAITEGERALSDTPEFVSRQEWDRVTRARNAEIRRH